MKELSNGKGHIIYESSDPNIILMFFKDSISAFDSTIDISIPTKGIELNLISRRWFSLIDDNLKIDTHYIKNHQPDTDDLYLYLRSTYYKQLKMIPYEFVLRRGLMSSKLDEYKKYKRIDGIESDDRIIDEYGLFDIPILTLYKKESKRDISINKSEFIDKYGFKKYSIIENTLFKVFNYADRVLTKNKICLFDSKFEFGIDKDDNLLLGDEILTPDSSRFVHLNNLSIHYDKQILRDYIKEYGYNFNSSTFTDVLKKYIDSLSYLRYVIEYKI